MVPVRCCCSRSWGADPVTDRADLVSFGCLVRAGGADRTSCPVCGSRMGSADRAGFPLMLRGFPDAYRQGEGN